MKLILTKKHILKAIVKFKRTGNITTCCPLWQAFHEKTKKLKFSVASDVISIGNTPLYDVSPQLPDELYTSSHWNDLALENAPYTFILTKSKKEALLI